jgi:DNA-binding IclR family transcriptional regulator
MGAAEGNVVKSVGRVFEVLELFERERSPLTAVSIARQLGYPPSSAITVLKSMMRLGYLHFDDHSKTYSPTVRLGFLTKWIDERVIGEAQLLSVLDEVVAETGETAAICCENDLQMQYLRIRVSPQTISFNISEGRVVPIFGSVIGLTSLSTRTDAEVVRIAERVHRGREGRFDIQRELVRIRRFRSLGYGVGYDVFTRGLGILAWALRPREAAQRLVISVGGPTPRVRAAEVKLVKAVRAALKRHHL